MSTSLVLGCLWVVAAAAVSFLPMRQQFPPGLFLLLTALVLIVAIGRQHGLWFALIAMAGFVSMFRKPLVHLGRQALTRIRDGRGGEGETGQ